MSTFDFGTIARNITEVRESPLLWLQGVNDYLQISIAGEGVLASPTMVLYENGVDVSGSKLSGSMSIPGGSRVIKTKSFISLVGGNNYKAYIYFTDDGVSQARELTLIVPNLGVNPSRFPLAHNKLRVIESPVLVYPSQSLTLQLEIAGQGEIGASPTMSIYKGTTNESGSLLSGVMSASGRIITLKTIINLTGGSEYLVYVYFTDGGKPTARYFEILCPKLGMF